MLLATAAWVHHAPRRSSASPTAPLGPCSRAHRGRADVHLGDTSPRRGCVWRNPGRAPGEGRRSGRSRPASGPASVSTGSRCPGGGRVPGEAGPRTTPATRPRGLQSLRAAPLPLPLTHLPRAARSQLECGRWPILPFRAHTHPLHGRARADHAPGPGAPRSLARSLARTRGSCAPTSAASRDPRPAAVHTRPGARSRPSRSPSSTITVVLGMHFTLEGQRLGGLVETSGRFLFKIDPLCLLPLFPS